MKTIIEMAREAGLVTNYGGREIASDKLLECFAELVRADEREACAKVCDEWGKNNMTAVMIGEDIRARGNT